MDGVAELSAFAANTAYANPHHSEGEYMKPLPKIVRIIEVQPFQLTLLWNTSEIRLLDFAPLFERWETEGDAKMAALQNWETFKQVALSENRTLHWPNVPVSYSFKGETRSAPLELDALELYRQSTLIKKTTAVQVGTMLREAREAAGLSQADVALKSGTTRNYISRIENDKSDIQLETLEKIVELGIGGEMIVQIKPGKAVKKAAGFIGLCEPTYKPEKTKGLQWRLQPADLSRLPWPPCDSERLGRKRAKNKVFLQDDR